MCTACRHKHNQTHTVMTATKTQTGGRWGAGGGSLRIHPWLLLLAYRRVGLWIRLGPPGAMEWSPVVSPLPLHPPLGAHLVHHHLPVAVDAGLFAVLRPVLHIDLRPGARRRPQRAHRLAHQVGPWRSRTTPGRLRRRLLAPPQGLPPEAVPQPSHLGHGSLPAMGGGLGSGLGSGPGCGPRDPAAAGPLV